MQRSKIIFAILLITLIGVETANATAPSTYSFSVKLTGEAQTTLNTVIAPSVTESTTTKIKMTTKDLLAVIEAHLAASYPDDARLVLRPDAFAVVDSSGTLLDGIEDSVLTTTNLDAVQRGISDVTPTGKLSLVNLTSMILTLNAGPSNGFDLYGVMNYTYKKDNATGKFQRKSITKLSGAGTWNDATIVVSGTTTHKQSN